MLVLINYIAVPFGGADMPYGRQRLHLHLHQGDVGEGHHERSLLRTEHHRQADSDVGVLSLKEVGVVGDQAPTIGEG